MALFYKAKSYSPLNRILANARRFSAQSKEYPFAARNGLSQQLTHGAPCEFVRCQTHINELQSPACIINIDVVEENCRTMEIIAANNNVNLRAHLKTHKVKINYMIFIYAFNNKLSRMHYYYSYDRH